MDPFKVPNINAKYAKKNVFGWHFPTERNGMTDYITYKDGMYELPHKLPNDLGT